MENNATRSEEFDIYKVTYPLYAIYLKMFLLLVAAISMVISSVMVILVILKDEKLRSVNNLATYCQPSVFRSSIYYTAHFSSICI